MRTKSKVRATLAGVFIIMLSLVLIISTSPVQAVPQPGHHFYGKVSGAEPGAVISARINGTEYSTTTVDSKNRYGYNPPFTVPSDDTGTMNVKEGGRNGETVEFYIQDKLVGQATFAVWGLTKLNLSLLDDVELTVTSAGNGSTNPSGTTTRPCGEVVSVTATADPCYELDYWEVNGVDSGSDNPLSITMDQDYSVTAYFAETEYDLTLGSGPNGDITNPTEGTHSYPCDTVVSVTATADPGHDFDYWEVNGVASGSDNPLSITMDQDYSVTAYFASNGEDGNPGDNGDTGNPTDPLGGSLVALVFVPGLAFEDVEAALASIDVYFDGVLETYYVYIPEDPSVGSGYWVEMGIP